MVEKTRRLVDVFVGERKPVSTFAVAIENGMVKVETVEGRAPSVSEFFSALWQCAAATDKRQKFTLNNNERFVSSHGNIYKEVESLEVPGAIRKEKVMFMYNDFVIGTISASLHTLLAVGACLDYYSVDNGYIWHPYNRRTGMNLVITFARDTSKERGWGEACIISEADQAIWSAEE